MNGIPPLPSPGRRYSRRDLLASAAAFSVTLPFLGTSPAFGSASDDYVSRYVRPDLQAAARAILAMAKDTPPLDRNTLETRRAAMLAGALPPLPGVPVEKRIISGAPGQPDVTVYVINARRGASRPGILHTHGGGFVLGSAAADNVQLQKLCQTLDCAAVNVDYRLAPETDWRGSVEDNYAGLKWLHANADELGVDRSRIAVMGASAGGGHAALLAIAARDRGEVPVAFQCLIYPMLDDRTGASRTVAPHLGRIIWNAQDNRFGWRSFLGREPGGAEVPRGAIPARLADFTNLPPAFMGVGTLDLFLDEDIDYAQQLNAAGVPAELIVVPGAYHAFDGVAEAPSAQSFNAAKVDALRRGLRAGST